MCSEYLVSQALIEDFHAGKEIAFCAITERFYATVYTFATNMLGDKEEAKDIAQDLFIKLWLKRSDFDSIGNIKAFLLVSCRNACLNYLRFSMRKKKNEKRVTESIYALITLDDELDEMLRYTIRKYLESLPDRQKQALKLIFFNGLKPREVADKMGITVDGVKKLRMSGLAKFREIFNSATSPIALFLLSLLIYALLRK
ncbi:sigma-70 family RNA polymerase sigma factor [Chitinophaga sp. CC14]|uniref:RNA polymerase sigma factor n=1 Tax=Chitinophaga sp. CC14 TaxID=3029199 RepID=UPI003B78CEC6